MSTTCGSQHFSNQIYFFSHITFWDESLVEAVFLHKLFCFHGKAKHIIRFNRSKDTSGFTSNTLLLRFPMMLSVYITRAQAPKEHSSSILLPVLKQLYNRHFLGISTSERMLPTPFAGRNNGRPPLKPRFFVIFCVILNI